ncbi:MULTISPECIES: aldose 1-epimerase family protein [unclassified Sphingomonas]|uniref:aldose 1-epimerase family protein n=1 Tax=unclassified Sphingomonas TaxID=196159 RepID=UPI0006F99EF9|nr:MULTISPECIES: aldose 1-epimerase family protein [unclassified Sphingomonas]KQM26631.1 aldose epimerase [Sphingomonas sp. Leaf9]KQM43037.1 aldose epimerase [Sphingomonas sp. Leaf11]
MTVTLTNGTLTVAVEPLGAELHSIKDPHGRELMTNADPAYWTGHAPILFPIIGAVQDDRYHVDGTVYHLAKHGFARRSMFVKVGQTDTSVRFELVDDAETRKVYPFAFVLHVEHRLDGATLHTEVTVTNSGDRDLPASIGFHPAFAWPLPYGRDRAAHRMVFSDAEVGTVAAIAANGTIAAERRPSLLDGKLLKLNDALFANDALVFDPVQSDSVTYGAEDGPQLRVDFPGMPKLGIWTKPGSAFVCIEPWDGIADPEGFAGDIFDKPGIHRVAPGATHRVAMSVTLVE